MNKVIESMHTKRCTVGTVYLPDLESAIEKIYFIRYTYIFIQKPHFMGLFAIYMSV